MTNQQNDLIKNCKKSEKILNQVDDNYVKLDQNQ